MHICIYMLFLRCIYIYIYTSNCSLKVRERERGSTREISSRMEAAPYPASPGSTEAFAFIIRAICLCIVWRVGFSV